MGLAMEPGSGGRLKDEKEGGELKHNLNQSEVTGQGAGVERFPNWKDTKWEA